MAGLVLDFVESADTLEFEHQLYFQSLKFSARGVGRVVDTICPNRLLDCLR